MLNLVGTTVKSPTLSINCLPNSALHRIVRLSSRSQDSLCRIHARTHHPSKYQLLPPRYKLALTLRIVKLLPTLLLSQTPLQYIIYLVFTMAAEPVTHLQPQQGTPSCAVAVRFIDHRRLANCWVDRPRRRPFSSWMKKLASFKGNSTSDANHTVNAKTPPRHAAKKQPSKNNNPYPESGRVNVGGADERRPDSPVPTGNTYSTSSLSRRRASFRSSEDGHHPPTIGSKSLAATVNTDVAHSDAAPSHAPSSGQHTSHTVGASNGRGADSTFSSPAPSVRSLTTTLTTTHSAAPGAQTTQDTINPQAMHFSHQFPTSPLPSAIPAHLTPHTSGGHPSTYNTAIANNLLTDNASILTLASSSKRRRRRSMDTDASVRALAPSSLFGGSRESLPLSVLSANIEPTTNTAHHQTRPSGALNERASIYSAAGIAPALPSDRNSYYAGKHTTIGDGSSIKSGYVGHGRNNSVSGSIGGIGAASSPLSSPRENNPVAIGSLSRSNSNWTADVDNDKPETDAHTEGQGKENLKG